MSKDKSVKWAITIRAYDRHSVKHVWAVTEVEATEKALAEVWFSVKAERMEAVA